MLIFPFPIFFTKFALFKKKNKTLAILIIRTQLGNLGDLVLSLLTSPRGGDFNQNMVHVLFVYI